MIKHQLFISKPAEELTVLPAYCENHRLSLLAHSFLRFETVVFRPPGPYDVLFFSSPRAVVHFFEQASPLEKTEIAAAGTQTAQILNHFGYEAGFIPEHSGDTKASAQSFAHWVGNRLTFFPVSDRSRLSYTQFLPPDQVESAVVYKTLVEPIELPEAAIYVFTSPSNVSGFFACNDLPEKAVIIAWGTSTSEALKAIGSIPHYTLLEADETALIAVIDQLLIS